MLETLNNWIISENDWIWTYLLIILLILIGLYFTFKSRFVQFRYFGEMFRLLGQGVSNGKGKNSVSSFQAFCIATASRVGTGNLAGVATAVALGGSGAVFWMWVLALIGSASAFVESTLAQIYKEKGERSFIGGPAFYIGKGLKKKGLALLFAFIIIITFGLVFNSVQANTIAIAFHEIYGTGQLGPAIILTFFTLITIFGGIHRIARVAGIIVPFMAIAYVLCCVILIVCNIGAIPHAVVEIVRSAFGMDAVAGGALGAIIVAMQKGIARGIFSNEAGLGSAPIAAAAARTKEPVRQGLVTMTGTFIDTIVICTMTGLAIVVSGKWSNPNLQGVEITDAAFQSGLPFPGKVSSFILMACLVFFAFTTILGWSYYSERCLTYLRGKASHTMTLIFRWLYIAAVFIGPYLTVEAVWDTADVFNGLMAFPNIIALLALSCIIAADTKQYFAEKRHLS